MKKASKRMRKATGLVDKGKLLSVKDAVELLKKTPNTKFDETVQLVMKLGVDGKKADQVIRGAVSLPKGIGKAKKVVVFADGADAEAAKAAGAIEVGGDDLAKKINDGWMDFDVAISTPAMMRVVGKLGKVLGPQGKMPTPKSGTVTAQVADAVREFAAGKVEFRADDAGNVHAVVGKKSFAPENLTANIEHFVEHIRGLKPSTAKGDYIQKVVLCASMSPGIPLDIKS